MLITVFTPTYNRSKELLKLFQSLQCQTNHNFEWVIVDDGSFDHTDEMITKFKMKNCAFPIRYYNKSNGGKHTAINYGVNKAQGELFLILDSDDSLPAEAIEIIDSVYQKCDIIDNLGGVCGLMAHHDGKQIGNGFPRDGYYENALNFRFKQGVTGDLLEVFKTSVLREFPFPEIEGEKFCPEALIWNRIATKYKLYCFNKVVYYRDYLAGGLTDRIVKIRMQSPMATMMTYQEMTEYDIPLKWKVRSAINYWRFRYCYRQKDDKHQQIPVVKWYWSVFKPIGWLMHWKDVAKAQ